MSNPDGDRARLLALELRVLLVRMRVAEDPFADPLEGIVNRFFLADGEDDRPDAAEMNAGPVALLGAAAQPE